MRPPEFTGGNAQGIPASRIAGVVRFNEAAGIHRRKPAARVLRLAVRRLELQ